MHCSFVLLDRRAGTRLVLHGEVDISTAALFRAALDAATDRSGELVEVDLRGVSFLDCSGVGALVAGWRNASDRGRILFVSHAWGSVHQILSLTGVLPLLSIDGRSPTTVDAPPAGSA